MTIIHVGRRVPKGFVEMPGSTHLGRGIWMFRVERVKAPTNRKTGTAKSVRSVRRATK